MERTAKTEPGVKRERRGNEESKERIPNQTQKVTILDELCLYPEKDFKAEGADETESIMCIPPPFTADRERMGGGRKGSWPLSQYTRMSYSV